MKFLNCFCKLRFGNRQRRREADDVAVLAFGQKNVAAMQKNFDGLHRRFSRRLAVGQELYGDRWAGLGFERLLSELEEEAADIGAWGVLALQAVQTAPNVSDVMRDHIWLLVHVAIALGAYSYQALALVRGDLEQRAGGPRAI